MKKLLVILLLFAGSLTGKGQKTIKEEIWSAQLSSLQMYATFSINENEEKKLERISFLAQDSRYTHITSYISLFYGSPKDCIEWYKRVIEIVKKEEVNTSVEVEKQTITVKKTFGQKILYIYEFDGGNGFRGITQGKLESGLEELQNWLSAKGIDINKEVLPKQTNETDKLVQPEKTNSVADELIKLKKLMDEGILNKEEFEAQKKKLLERKNQSPKGIFCQNVPVLFQ